MAIVGYMGSGKTTLGRLLARATGLEFVDLDRTSSKKAGKEIPEIFAEYGEGRFRDLEREALREALDGKTPCIVACGGGVVVRQENRALLQTVTTVFLSEDTGVLYGRTRGPGRPLRAASRETRGSRATPNASRSTGKSPTSRSRPTEGPPHRWWRRCSGACRYGRSTRRPSLPCRRRGRTRPRRRRLGCTAAGPVRGHYRLQRRPAVHPAGCATVSKRLAGG